MGIIANLMLNGKVFQICGAYLEPNETVYLVGIDIVETKMPKNGEPFGIPVTCEDCNDD